MSLLIRIAQTRQGAERLLEARLLPTLASCDYLDARPEADQAFMGMQLFRFLDICSGLMSDMHRSRQFPSISSATVPSTFHARTATRRRHTRHFGAQPHYGSQPGSSYLLCYVVFPLISTSVFMLCGDRVSNSSRVTAIPS